jgi:hypothetical protein
MLYDCSQIHEILNGDLEAAIDQEAFLDHVDNCSGCKSLAILDPGLDNEINAVLPEPAPAKILQTLTEFALRDFANRRRVRRIVQFQRFVMVLAGGLGLLVLALNSDIVSRIRQYVSPTWQRASSFLNFDVALPPNLLSHYNSLFHSSIFLPALIGILALIWSFAILGLKETSR